MEETTYKNTRLTKWDKRYLDQAKFVSTWSKDKSTKTGVVIVNSEDNTELVMGYNGFPRGGDDYTDKRRYEKPMKYVWTEHAERNAIYKAARLGISLNGCTMYATYFPCVECTRAIIQAGIKTLYVEKPDFNHEKWGESWVDALIMLKECKIEVVWTNEDDISHIEPEPISEKEWLAQYLEDELMWYLTEHGEDGVETELFPKTRRELDMYIEEHRLTVRFAEGDENKQK